MTSEDLKNMKRVELLEMLYQQQQRIEELEKENETPMERALVSRVSKKELSRWVEENQTPVDKTADELSREAQADG